MLLGTAGALGHLKTWIDGRAAVVVNADLVTDADLGAAVASWDRERMRLVAAGRAALDPDLRLCAALMPWASVERLAPTRAGSTGSRGRRPPTPGSSRSLDAGAVTWFDCGTARSYLAANLWASGGAT